MSKPKLKSQLMFDKLRTPKDSRLHQIKKQKHLQYAFQQQQQLSHCTIDLKKMETKPCICSKTNSRSSLGLSVSWLAQNATQCSGTQLLQNLGPLGVFVHLEFWVFSIFHSQFSLSLFVPTFEKIWTEMRVAGGHKATAVWVRVLMGVYVCVSKVFIAGLNLLRVQRHC